MTSHCDVFMCHLLNRCFWLRRFHGQRSGKMDRMEQMFKALMTRFDESDTNLQIEVNHINCRIDDMFTAVMTKLDGLDNAPTAVDSGAPRRQSSITESDPFELLQGDAEPIIPPFPTDNVVETIVASASLVASAYIAKDKLVCAKATQSSTFVPGQTTHGDSEAIRNTCAICARSLWPTHNDADICTSCIELQRRLFLFISSIQGPINQRMLNAHDMREFRHAGARRLRAIMQHSEWKDGKVQCLTSQDSEHLEQFLRDELIKHDVK